MIITDGLLSRVVLEVVDLDGLPVEGVEGVVGPSV